MCATGIRVGILALQGSYAAHARALSELSVEHVEIRQPADLADIDALIMPGGESTTMTLLLESSGLRCELTELITGGMPVLSTCAGTILLARGLDGDRGSVKVRNLGLLDAVIDRNAYGRQSDSFETALRVDWQALGMDDENAAFHGVFIRAPRIAELGERVVPCAHLSDEVVAVRQDNIIAATFHPELAGDTRIHQALIKMT